jgi:hypothetical protein
MSWLLSIVFAASAVTCAFFHPLVAWLVIALPELFLIWMSISLTARKWTWNQYEQLSDDAKAMFQKYGHFYSMPHAASDFSAASSLLWKANIALIAVGVFRGFWWGLAIGLPTTFIFAFLARLFDPSAFIRIPSQRAAHQEIMSRAFS